MKAKKSAKRAPKKGVVGNQASKGRTVSPRGGTSTLVSTKPTTPEKQDREIGVQGSKMGRPSKYRPEFAKQAHNLCLLGATNPELARFFEVEVSTIDYWIAHRPDFSSAVKGGRIEADAKVVKSLYRRALGYKQQSVKIMQFQGVPVVVPFVEKFAPDTTAAIFWLKNRAKRDWRDRIEHTGANGASLPAPIIQVMPARGEQEDA